MSLRTVLRLSDEWHEAVANYIDTSDTRTFPQPWCDGATINGLKIDPITNPADLYREGKEMRNCVGTYGGAVLAGGRYIYSVTENGKKVATAELINNDGHAKLGQARGPCNAVAPNRAVTALRRWLRTTNTVRLPQPEEPRPETTDFYEGFNFDGDEIPF